MYRFFVGILRGCPMIHAELERALADRGFEPGIDFDTCVVLRGVVSGKRDPASRALAVAHYLRGLNRKHAYLFLGMAAGVTSSGTEVHLASVTTNGEGGAVVFWSSANFGQSVARLRKEAQEQLSLWLHLTQPPRAPLVEVDLFVPQDSPK